MNEEITLPQETKTPRHHLAFYFIIFILFVLTWLGGFWLWQQHQLQAYKLNHSQKSLDNFNMQLSALDKQLNSQNNALQIQQASLNQLQTTLSQTQDLINHNQNSWRFIEAEHLLVMANMALQVQDNVAAAILMLQNANQTLQAINNPLLTSVKQKISADLSKLQNAPTIDITNIYSQLTTLSKQALTLPIVVNQYSADVNDNLLTPAQTNNASVWQQSLYEIKKALSELVIIRRSEAPVSPLPSTFQQAEIQTHLSLLFAQAQTALLLQQSDIYTATLNQIITLINYYTAMNPASQAIVGQIRALKVDINPMLPNINDSLTELRAVEGKLTSDPHTSNANQQGNKS